MLKQSQINNVYYESDGACFLNKSQNMILIFSYLRYEKFENVYKEITKIIIFKTFSLFHFANLCFISNF